MAPDDPSSVYAGQVADIIQATPRDSRGDHGFQQPMKFCWWLEKCWDEIKDAEPGTLQSEPYIRKQFAGQN